jgi:alkyl hydroperoxide reductase subunit AhpC
LLSAYNQLLSANSIHPFIYMPHFGSKQSTKKSFCLQGDAPTITLTSTPYIIYTIHFKETLMSLRLGDEAPDFTQESTQGPISLHQWLGDSWGVLFSHPADFTPVCTTELGLTAKLKEDFSKRNVKAIALSVDPVDSHNRWINDINETQLTQVNFPILADADRKVATLYDMIHPNANATLTVRSLFIIDPAKKIRLIITYPASTGRNFDEILRVIDSLQLTEHHKVATPGNWKSGDDVVIVPALQDPEEIARRFPKGYKVVKPYLRLTPDPRA